MLLLRWSQQHWPVSTSALTGLAVMGVGDSAVQLGVDGQLDVQRTLVSSTYNGFIYSPFMHVWWSQLDAWWPGRSASAVTRKVITNQLAITPFNSLFFIVWSKAVGAAVTAGRSGSPPDWTAVYAETETHLRRELPSLLVTSCAFWPFAHALNFRYLPLSLRIVFMSSCSVCWGGYLSFVTHRKQQQR